MFKQRVLSAGIFAIAAGLPFFAQAESLFGEDESEKIKNYEIFSELEVRQDAVRNLPRPVDADFDRTLLRARIGVLWSNDAIDVGLTGKINQNTDANSDSRRNLDNEKADDETIDDAFLTYNYADGSFVKLGQSALPISLTPAVWDNDLRPRGITLSHNFKLSEYSDFSVTAGTYEVNHVFDDEAELDAIQFKYSGSQGLPLSFTGHLSYLSFSNLDELVQNGIARTNSRAQGQLAEDFDLVDAQLGVQFSRLAKPLRIGVNLTRNLRAEESDSARVSVTYGVSKDQPGLELGFAAQRIQRDAVVAAFNDDDWWFPTNLRGVTAWVGYGFTESLRLRVAGFSERRDDLSDNNRRFLVNLDWSI